MKKLLLILSLLFACAIWQKADAKGVIVYHDGPKFRILKELPADQKVDGKHVNLGVAFEQFGLFWMPVWNYGETQYALVSDDEETAWSLDDEAIAHYDKEFNLNLAGAPSIPLWDKIGIKPLLVILLLLIIWGYLPSKKKDEA
ncbi:MAG: hypothetical protein E6767_09880 [Dysgonomonas sp.]|nr:hypothetical protein [Dysgonomonas sp.]